MQSSIPQLLVPLKRFVSPPTTAVMRILYTNTAHSSSKQSHNTTPSLHHGPYFRASNTTSSETFLETQICRKNCWVRTAWEAWHVCYTWRCRLSRVVWERPSYFVGLWVHQREFRQIAGKRMNKRVSEIECVSTFKHFVELLKHYSWDFRYSVHVHCRRMNLCRKDWWRYLQFSQLYHGFISILTNSTFALTLQNKDSWKVRSKSSSTRWPTSSLVPLTCASAQTKHNPKRLSRSWKTWLWRSWILLRDAIHPTGQVRHS